MMKTTMTVQVLLLLLLLLAHKNVQEAPLRALLRVNATRELL